MPPFESWNKIDEDGDEELADEPWLQGNKDAVLFAIDCSESMLELRDDGSGNKKCYLQAALEGCRDIQKRKAVVGPNDTVGILVFNTAYKVDSEGGTSGEIKDYCHVYQPVAQVNAPRIQALIELLDEAAEDHEKLTETFTPKPGSRVPLSDVFTSCNWMLRDGAPTTSFKRLFLITDEDNPHPGNAQLLKTATNTLADLRQLGVIIQTFFISSHEKPFKIAKFYSSVLADDAQYSDIVNDVVLSFDTLLSEMRFREMPKRPLWSIPLQLGENFTIAVKGYGLVTEQKRPYHTYRSNLGRNTEEVASKPLYVDEELQFEVDNTRIVYGMSLGVGHDEEEEETSGMLRLANKSSKVFYSPDEIREFRTLGLEPGIKLLGFKDLGELHNEDNVKHAFFIYPDESKYSGSTRTFSALLNSMVKKKVFGLVMGLLRRNSSPAFFAMVAQEEKTGLEYEPPGFHLIQFPFADDIREAPYEKACRAEESTKEAAIAWIEKLKIKSGQYNADDNPNPALTLHYAQLEALAFNEEFDKDAVEDFTAPPTAVIKKRAGHLISAWKDAINEDESSHQWFATKTSASKSKGGGALIEDSEIKSRYDDGTLHKLTAAQMKDFLKSKAQSTAGKKAELQERIGEWVDKQPA